MCVGAGFIDKVEGGLDARLMRDCTMELNGDVIIENGRIVDDRMIVERIKYT